MQIAFHRCFEVVDKANREHHHDSESMRKMYAPQQIAKSIVAANLVEAWIGGQLENRHGAVVVQIAVQPAKCLG